MSTRPEKLRSDSGALRWIASSSPLLAAAVLAACSSGKPATAPPAALSGPLEPHEVAALWPLPASLERNTLLRMTAEGAKGVLLPARVVENLENLTPGLREPGAPTQNEALWPLMRALSAYVDPCWPRPDIGCEQQVRVSFQPIVAGPDGRPTTLDIALHAHYEIPLAEFKELVRELAALKRQTRPRPEAPIGVHPVMRDEGPGGPFALAYQEIVLKHCGDRTLVSLTYSTAGGLAWGGFDYHSGRSPVLIPATEYETGVHAERQLLLNRDSNGDLDVVISPATRFSMSMQPLLDSRRARTATREELRAAIAATMQIDNPATPYSPVTMDCVSCHVATPIRLWAQRKLDLPVSFYMNAYRTLWNTSLDGNEANDDVGAHRCLGYAGSKVSVSLRTINDAAMNTDIINSQYAD